MPATTLVTPPSCYMLEGRRIILGVSGGIAAYKAIEVCRRLVDSGAHVVPVLTEAAHNMVGPTTFTALASEPVKTSLWADRDPIPHTRMGQSADAIVVCPATARVISDLATGRSGDLLAATLIATAAPVVVCPAMHTEMWEHPAVQDNIATLRRRGVVVVPPEEGRLAGGDMGKGRLAAPETVVAAVQKLFVGGDDGIDNKLLLSGRQILVTAGGTRESIDPVRYLGNRSTGKQGHALAEKAAQFGAEVTLVTTSGIQSSSDIKRVDVVTAADMHAAVSVSSDNMDVIIMAAAVADFRPSDVSNKKLKKADGTPNISLEPTVDILAELGAAKKPGQILVGFAAETNDLRENALAKLSRKGADLLVANDVSAPGVGFAHDTNEVTIFSANGDVQEVPLSDKESIAEAVLRAVEQLLAN